jgi:DNA-binding GntR family transcriptional regulator
MKKSNRTKPLNAEIFAQRRPEPGYLRTKEEQAYEDLKSMILSGDLPKDVFLSQRMLAAKVDTNITTIRTALRQLERDGLMENVPQWGVRIPVETEERLRDLYFVRDILEIAAVRRVVQRRDTIDRETLQRKAKLADDFARQLPENVVAFSKAHFDFHCELAEQSGSELLLYSLNRVHFRNWLLWHDVRLWKNRHLIDHQKLVQVILTQDEEDVIKYMRVHINNGLENELAELKKVEEKAHQKRNGSASRGRPAREARPRRSAKAK